jgi:hypothetical protein
MDGYAEDSRFLGADNNPTRAVDTSGKRCDLTRDAQVFAPRLLRSRRAKSGADEGAFTRIQAAASWRRRRRSR